jgi:hypothetical protein
VPARRRFGVTLLGAAALGLVLAGPGPARAGYTSVSLAALTNANIRTYTGGTNYPIAPTGISVAGVPFALVQFQGAPNTLGVIQTPGGTNSFTIVTDVPGATTVYTLMNSTFGVAGQEIGNIEFKGANGSDVTFQIVEGDNIRDHFNDGFNNSATNVVPDPFLNGSQNPSGPDRLDMQTFVLPSSFATDTLTEIIFSSSSSSGDPNGQAFLAAATVLTPDATGVPEPASLVLLATGALGLLGYGWRWRKAARAA